MDNLRFKFRAWDKEDNTMKMVTLIDWPGWSVCVQNDQEYYEIGDRNSFKNEETDRCILMQYTGLHDKNGVEIYEGDILYGSDVGVYIPVKWYSGSAGFQLAWMDGRNDIEVIGNIFENPELLK